MMETYTKNNLQHKKIKSQITQKWKKFTDKVNVLSCTLHCECLTGFCRGRKQGIKLLLPRLFLL